MRNLNKRLAIIALMAFAIVSTACNDNQAKAIAANVDRVALLIKDGREIRDELETQNIIGADEAKAITIGLLKVNSALKAFNDRARAYTTAGGGLTPEGKIELKRLAENIASAVSELISNGTFGVKNTDAQVRINAVIGSLKQVTLTIVDTVAAIKTKGAQ